MTDDLTKCDRLRLYAAVGISSYTRLDPEDIRELTAARSAPLPDVRRPSRPAQGLFRRRVAACSAQSLLIGGLALGFYAGVLFCSLVEALR